MSHKKFCSKEKYNNYMNNINKDSISKISFNKTLKKSKLT